jgi:predicted small secreted protein
MTLLTRVRLLILILVLSAVALAGCGQTPPGPVDVVQSYISSIAEGNFNGACSQLDAHARSALRRAAHSARPCSLLLAGCFPNQATKLKSDQTQLLYATVDISTHGSRADAVTGNTQVAKAVKTVSLIQKQGQWKLDSYGKERCRRAVRRR